ncbi:MAG TPA: bifunctional diguanylate cyclase/phosphodiesterase [Solirubrobacteraceae bacterium]|nr:bifunctional diguanylate cyclase/phosphodiesterase [Solirubrobacteraceae bacterium]
MRLGRQRRTVVAVFGLLGLGLLAYVVSEIVRPDGQSWPLIDNWGVAAFELVASGLCLAGALVTRRSRGVALLVGLGLLAWSLGDVVVAIESSGGGAPAAPSLADVFYLAFYPLSYAGLMLLVHQQARKFNFAKWLDGAVAGLGAAAVCAAFAFHGILQATGGDGVAQVAINLAYPIGDLLLVGLVIGGSAMFPGGRSTAWVLLAVGYCVNTVGDIFNLFGSSFGGSHVGTLFNAVAWPTSTLLIAAAVWARPTRSRGRVHIKVGFLLPGIAAAAALLILFVGSFGHTGRVAVALAAATLVTAGVRFVVSLGALRSLTENRHRQAITDELTGLGNRRALTQLLEPFLTEHIQPDSRDRSLAFLYVDLNRFKEVNDSFGHPAGDALLRQLGARLKGSLRASDLLVRLGGDEFGVALMGADAQRAEMVAERLIAQIEEPFLIDSVRAKVSASIGIAIVPDDAADTPGIMACADLAMYRAKISGERFAIYQEELDGGHGLPLVEELRCAIERRELELHYQPQLDLVSGEIVAVEALVRWPHARLGLVAPLEFLPLAEEAGLMGPLTAAVLDQALMQCAAWRDAGRGLTVSVNVSSTNLLDPAFPDQVAEALDRHGLPASALVLEITETTAIADFDQSKVAIEALRDLGLVVSVDDFGAGFTSLTYLSSLAVGELKLDRSFIVGLSSGNGGRNLALVRATIALAHALGLRVVAEGIEDRASLHLLTSIGCDLAQGYLISRPKPAAELSFEAHPMSGTPASRRARARSRPAFRDLRPQLALEG